METKPVNPQELPDSVRAAIDRALARNQRDALIEVEQILDATVRVAQRVAPTEPRVTDIVAEAATSNQTFYRYFAGKHDLMLAVLERGILLVRTYLEHQMAKHDEPTHQITAWIEGLLRQVTHPGVAQQSAAVTQQAVLAGRLRNPDGLALLDQLGQLLVTPLTAAGRPQPQLDARVLQDTVLGTLRRHVANGTTPTNTEQTHLVAFCTQAVDLT